MKKTTLLKQAHYFFIFAILLFVQQQITAQTDTTQNKVPTTKQEVTDLAPITLLPFRLNVTARVGQDLYYSFEEHPSVGYQSTYAIEDEEYIVFVRTEKDPERPTIEGLETDGDTEVNVIKPVIEKSGGDKKLITHVFKANKVGETRILIKNYFRSELKDSTIFIITIEE